MSLLNNIYAGAAASPSIRASSAGYSSADFSLTGSADFADNYEMES